MIAPLTLPAGHWSTNQTKVYYSVGGDVRLKELKDEKQSDLLASFTGDECKNGHCSQAK
jgi:hypothetical protein